MTISTTLTVIILYFLLLIAISLITGKKSNNKTFFVGNRSSAWYLVAFGMIGASLSGITFISVPGSVMGKGLTYVPIVLGYFIGYLVIANVLMPIYYKLNLTTIYSYIKQRFGFFSHKTAASYFILSRVIGATLRLFLVAEVLDIFLFEPLNFPYWAGIIVTVLLIWVYTFRGGIKTIVWTDAIQTFSMLLAVGLTIYFLRDAFDVSWSGLADKVTQSEYAKVVHWKGNGWGTFFLGILNGMFITIVMTGLDQDMMQKNLSCKNVKEARKNMFWFSVILIPVNILFLSLGILLYEYAFDKGFLEISEKGALMLKDFDSDTITEITKDRLFPSIAYNGYLPLTLGVVFLVGLIAAAYSSADSALTSLTTSFTIDILDKEDDPKLRKWVHVGMSVLLILSILLFKELTKLFEDESVVWELFKAAGFTYGPLLGLFAFGILTKLKVIDILVPVVCVLCPAIAYLFNKLAPVYLGYEPGFEILLINGALVFLSLVLLSGVKKMLSPAS